MEQSDNALELAVHFDFGDPMESPHGPHALFFTEMGDEAEVRSRVDAAVGFLASFEGRAIANEFLFEMESGPSSMSLYGPTFESPAMHGRPNLRREYLRFIEEAHRHLVAMPADVQGRIRLALRWVNTALQETGVDAFLKYWLALETLAMPDTTNIRPIIETLSEAYGISYEEARDRFLVGRLYGRRSDIVHAGDLRPVHPLVLIYAMGVFIDLLRAELEVEPVTRAGRLLERPDFSDLEGLI